MSFGNGKARCVKTPCVVNISQFIYIDVLRDCEAGCHEEGDIGESSIPIPEYCKCASGEHGVLRSTGIMLLLQFVSKLDARKRRETKRLHRVHGLLRSK